MIDDDKLTGAIFDAIREVNDLLPPGAGLEPALETVLFDSAGTLDSLGVVNLVVAVEEKIELAFGTSISLVDAVGAPDAEERLRTVGSLREYISGLLNHGT